MVASICLFVHSIFPNYFTTVGSNIIKELYNELKEEKSN